MRLAGFDIDAESVQFQAIRAGGPGGQNVNKVSSAVQLRFDIRASGLSQSLQQRLLQRADQRLSNEGVLVIRAQRFRSQDRNRQDALARLEQLIFAAARPVKPRRPTRPGKAAVERRLQGKKTKGRTKSLRSKPLRDE